MSKQLMSVLVVAGLVSHTAASTATLAPATTCSDPLPVTCSLQGQSVCWVYDPIRTVAPWSGSTLAWPQCYSETDPLNPLVCNNNFLCPVDAPYVCGRNCQNVTCTGTTYASSNKQPSLCDNTTCYDYPSVYNVNTTTYTTTFNASSNTTTAPQPTINTTQHTYTFLPSAIQHGCINQVFLNTAGGASTGITNPQAVSSGGSGTAGTSSTTAANGSSSGITANSTSKVVSSSTMIQSTIIGTTLTALVAYML